MAALRAGHRALKLKIGFGAERDLANLAALRALTGAAPLAADANQGWALEQALAFAPELDRFALAWLEEPLRVDQPWPAWLELKSRIRTPLAGGENIASEAAFADAFAAGDSFKLFYAATYTGAFTNFNLPLLATNLMWNTRQLAENGTLSVIAIVPPVFSGTVMSGGGFQMTFSGNSGQTYKVLTSTNLLLPAANWMVMTNGTFGAGPATYTDSLVTNSARFYRIISP